MDLWALKQRTNSPILTLAVENSRIIYTDAEYYTFKLKSAADQTTRLIAGGNGSDQQGRDGEEIPFIVNRRDLGPGAIFKFDNTSRVSFTVVDREIEDLGGQFRLWARLNTSAFVESVSQAEFQPNRQIIKLADTRGLDFASHKAVWHISGIPSMMKFKNYLTNVTLQQHYRVTTGAVEYLQANHRFDSDQIQMYEETALTFYQVRGIADNKVTDLRNPEEYKRYWERVQEEKAKGNGEMAFINLLDNLAVRFMLQQNNNLMVWSDGIDKLYDGYDSSRLIPGIWFQLDQAGYKHSYSIDTFSLDTITDAIKDFEFGKVELRESISTNVYVIKTGRGGQELIYKEFLKKGFDIPAIVNNVDHGFVTGQANNLSYRAPRFIDYQIPNIGILRVEWEPGFDPVLADEFINPVLPGGYRLTSYTMLIEDYNTGRDNIVILRRNNSKIRMIIENGDQSHPLTRMNHNIANQNIQVHQATDELSGYQVKFVGKADSAVVLDPTKLLKLVPKNPRTGIAAL